MFFGAEYASALEPLEQKWEHTYRFCLETTVTFLLFSHKMRSLSLSKDPDVPDLVNT